MKRRDLLASAPAALAALALPAASQAAPDTPVMRAYREWWAYWTWLNGPETRGMDEDEYDRLVDALEGYVSRLMTTPAQSPLDTIAKLRVAVMDREIYHTMPELGRVEDEAMAWLAA